MDLARAAHREGLRDMQPPPVRTPVPGVDYTHFTAPPSRSTLFASLFTTLARCVRQTILLETRLERGEAEDDNPHAPTVPHHAPPPGGTPHPKPARAPSAANPNTTHPDRLRADAPELAPTLPTGQAPDHLLAAIRAETETAAAALARLAPETTPAPIPYRRREIPKIPPGPAMPLTALERSVLAFQKTRAPKPPD